MSIHSNTEIWLNMSYEAIVPHFLELRRQELEAVGDAIEQSDFGALKSFGHNLHGTGSGYGLDELSELGGKLEAAAQTFDIQVCSEIYRSLAAFLSNVRINYRNSILFVDDQDEVLTLLRRLFQSNEYICYFASSAAEALEILKETPVDVLVSDLVMPDMGGLELLSIVRERFPRVVRLVLSGQAQVPSILAAINTGQVFRYLTKPWRVDSDARSIIAEAVLYSAEINQRELGYLHVTLNSISQLLDHTKSKYLILGKERIEALSQNLQDEWKLGQDVDAGDMRLRGSSKIPLGALHTAYVWEH